MYCRLPSCRLVRITMQVYELSLLFFFTDLDLSKTYNKWPDVPLAQNVFYAMVGFWLNIENLWKQVLTCVHSLCLLGFVQHWPWPISVWAYVPRTWKDSARGNHFLDCFGSHWAYRVGRNMTKCNAKASGWCPFASLSDGKVYEAQP